MLRACISREFRAFAANQSSPVIDWLRALAAHAHPLCGGRGVGAIGMCFTGNFALSMMLEPAVLAPVLSQPSLPIFQRGGMHIAPDELAAGEGAHAARGSDRARLSLRGRPVLPRRTLRGLRSRRSAIASSGACCPTPPPTPTRRSKNPHSVVTAHLIDREGEPTRQALDEILGFFRQRLVG